MWIVRQGNAPAPFARKRDAARDGGGGAAERDREARELSHAAALVRDSFLEAGYDIRTVQEFLEVIGT
jgi:hypothetical protein